MRSRSNTYLTIMAMPIPSRTLDTASAALDLFQTEFVLDEAASEAFVRALSNPVEPNDALRWLVSSKAPFAEPA